MMLGSAQLESGLQAHEIWCGQEEYLDAHLGAKGGLIVFSVINLHKN